MNRKKPPSGTKPLVVRIVLVAIAAVMLIGVLVAAFSSL